MIFPEFGPAHKRHRFITAKGDFKGLIAHVAQKINFIPIHNERLVGLDKLFGKKRFQLMEETPGLACSVPAVN